MEQTHSSKNEILLPFSKDLQANVQHLKTLFSGCYDFVNREMKIGGTSKINIYLAYIDNMIDRSLLEYNIIKNLLTQMDSLPFQNQYDYIKEHALQTADLKEIYTMDQISQSILSGDVVLLVDHFDKAIAISLKNFPGRGVPSVETEVTIKGPKDSFTESIATNTVLIRRRIRDTRLKLESMQIGIRSRTSVNIAYISGIAEESVIEEIKKRLNSFEIDGIFDVGMLEQLTETSWYSPFPQFQSTERPDKTASALMEGRVALIVDNSPMVLLLPVTISAFYQASDDYYRNWDVASFVRILRYIGSLLSIAMPALYIAVANYQPELFPTPLILSFAADRYGVPFSVLAEVIILQLAFEMLTEAGIRLPSPMGNTIGIVGGLIIGDAAIRANLISPMVVIVVAFTAIASYTIPNETFSGAFRIIRYGLIILSAFLGLYGVILGLMLLLIHLSGLTSFGVPYLSPFVARTKNSNPVLSDSILKYPIFKLKYRPLFAQNQEKIRFKDKNKL